MGVLFAAQGTLPLLCLGRSDTVGGGASVSHGIDEVGVTCSTVACVEEGT